MKPPRLLSTVVAAALAAAGVVALPPAPASATEEIYPVPASGAWTVDGRAYGHGRGMSQWGAQGGALQGASAAAILDFYYPGTAATDLRSFTGGLATTPYVKTTLADYAPSSRLTVWVPEGRAIRMGKIYQEVVEPSGFWTVTVSGSTVTAARADTFGGDTRETRTYTGVTPDAPVRFESFFEVGVIISAPPTSSAYPQRAGQHRWYRGDIRIEPTGGIGFNVTNSLPMEEYLKSVVPRESPASWRPAALEAQAVAARSYAWYKVAHGSTLCDTTSCQVYYGYANADTAGRVVPADTPTGTFEHPNTDAAIAATAHQVRTYNGAIAYTEFSSSNGGWTTASSVPYQVAKADPWTGTAPGDTVTSWSASLSVARVQQSCPSGGTLRNLVVVSRTGQGALGGRINQVRLECSTGNVTINNPAFGLRSSWWRPRTSQPVLGSPAVSATTITSGDQMSIGVTPNVGLTWTLTVTDRSTGNTALTTTGTAEAGVRFNATWFGTYAPYTSGDRPYVGPGVYDLTLSAVDAAGTAAAPFRTTVTVLRPADPPTVAAVPLVANGGYVPVTPTRLTDTRLSFQSLGAGQRADISVLGKAGIPSSGVTAVVLNVTAVNAVTDTHLRIWPAGTAMPNASSVNTDARRTQAAMVTVGVGGEGKISVYNAAGTLHYIVDVLGYYTTDLGASSRYTPVDPVRALDTRSSGGAMANDATRVVDVAGALGVGAGSVSAVAVNLTAVASGGPGYVVAYGSGAVPATSSLNLSTSGDVANRAVVPVVDGKITLRLRGGPANVIVDVVGWYAAPGVTTGSVFTPVQPSRILDSRSASAFGGGETRTVTVVGGAVPSAVTAVVGTLTATGQTSPVTHARLWPAGRPLTPTSDLNSGAGRTQANAVVVRVGTGGAVQLYNDRGQSHLILDVVGYFN